MPPRMGQFAFGYRQLAVVVAGALRAGGIGLQAALAARGDWAIGTDKLPPAWSLVSSGSGGGSRILWLGELSGDPFPAPGGGPIDTGRGGGSALRYGLPDRSGAGALDVGRSLRR